MANATVAIASKVQSYHGHLEHELAYYLPQKQGWVETTLKRHYIIRERELSYRVYPHYHPYVEQLMQKLLRKSTAGLQAADTEYVGQNASLPGSLKVLWQNPSKDVAIPSGSPISLLSEVEATLPDASTMTLFASLRIETAAAVQATLPDGLVANLVEGMSGTPPEGETFTPPPNNQAILAGDTRIVLSALTPVTLHDGRPASIPAGTEVLLERGVQLQIPNGEEVTLLKSRRLPVLYAELFTPAYYKPADLVQRPYPVKDLDFTYSGAYSVYNWEVFCHAPLTIAMHLSKNQRFAEAQRWFHFLFDPTDDSEEPTPERFWKVRPFQETDVRKAEEILINLVTGDDEDLRTETMRSIEAWQAQPFRPHVIARYRQQAYMYKVVMAYLDNLIAWGDSLFRQDTGEAIDEAMMLYVLAANILGPRPQAVPTKGTVRPQTYANLRKDLRQFGTVMREVEASIGFDLAPLPDSDAGGEDRLATVRSLGKALYFAVPRNDKLMSYWDTVADRLFKIRNSLNFQGVFRQLALFEPPIDPAMLARATAAGLDISAVINGLNQPLPLVRFTLLAQKAAEIAQEVKSLGNSLLAAMEKEDGEAMALLRAQHEKAVLEMVQKVKYSQVQEARKAKEGLQASLTMAVQRYTYFQQLLGQQADVALKAVPALGELAADTLEKMQFNAEEPVMEPVDVEIHLKDDLEAEAGGKKLIAQEAREIERLVSARDSQGTAGTLDKIGSFLAIIPDFTFNIEPFGAGSSIGAIGGGKLSQIMSAIANFWRSDADKDTYKASNAGRVGNYTRREIEWSQQSNQAIGDINLAYKQIRAAEIREAIAELELKNHNKQMEQAIEIERFLNEKGTEKTGKITNKAFYAWMKRDVKGLYAQFFQFAFDLAKKAERALQLELGDTSQSFIQYGYLAGKEGLLAGEKLYLDLKRMEMAYYELNRREYELTKHVSLQQVDPLALIQLRTTGSCTVRLPEALFDLDGPGHYFRRIKSVAVSVPCVTGPYASLNCTLTLLKSSIRTSQLVGDEYARRDAEDDRFNDNFSSLQSIVTSTGQNDSGLFEANLHDERYLPFENSGVISEWQIRLPADPSKNDPQQFDYNTISDVILHIRYTAREGGELLRQGAIGQVKALIGEAQAAGSVRLFSIRHEFPAEWAKFRSQEAVAGQRFELAVTLRPEHFPFWSQGRLESVKEVQMLARSTKDPIPGSLNVADRAGQADAGSKVDALAKDGSLGNLLVGSLENVPRPLRPDAEVKLYFEDRNLSDLWIAVTWGE